MAILDTKSALDAVVAEIASHRLQIHRIICTMNRRRFLSPLLAATLALAAAASLQSSAIGSGTALNNNRIRNPQSAIRNSEWKSLFDGSSLGAWKGYKTDAVPAGWKIADRALVKDTRV